MDQKWTALYFELHMFHGHVFFTNTSCFQPMTGAGIPGSGSGYGRGVFHMHGGRAPGISHTQDTEAFYENVTCYKVSENFACYKVCENFYLLQGE